MKVVTQFETSDGKKFDNELNAKGHEKSLSIAKSIRAYAKAATLPQAEATRALRLISGYAVFMEDYVESSEPDEYELAEAAKEKAEAAAKAKTAPTAANDPTHQPAHGEQAAA